MWLPTHKFHQYLHPLCAIPGDGHSPVKQYPISGLALFTCEQLGRHNGESLGAAQSRPDVSDIAFVGLPLAAHLSFLAVHKAVFTAVREGRRVWVKAGWGWERRSH